MQYTTLFRDYLLRETNSVSQSTIKNYYADINHFVRWFEQTQKLPFDPKLINLRGIENFKGFLTNSRYTPATIERHVSTLRKFFQFLKDEHFVTQDPFELAKEGKPIALDPFHLREFKNFLYVEGQKPNTIKNYLLDLTHFFSWLEKVYTDYRVSEEARMAKINSQTITEYAKRLLEVLKLSPASVTRKLSSLRQYCQWAKDQGYLAQNPFAYERIQVDPQEPTAGPLQEESVQQPRSYARFPPIRLGQKIIHMLDRLLIWAFIAPITHLFLTLKTIKKPSLGSYIRTKPSPLARLESVFYSPYQQGLIHLPYRITPKILGLLLLVLLVTGFAGIFAYQQFFVAKPQDKITQPVEKQSGEDQFTFAGRLTDKEGKPISTKQLVIFSFYSDGQRFDSLLHQQVHDVIPDSEGFFNIQLPDVPKALLTSTTPVYLGLAIEGDAEMRPRHLIAGQDTQVSLFNTEGKFIIANDSPSIVATSGKFTITANQLMLETSSGSDGTIVLSPDGAGKVDVLSPLINSITGVLDFADALSVNASSSTTPLTVSVDAAPLLTVDPQGLLTIKSLAVEGASSFRGGLTPDISGSYNIGSTQKMWNSIYANNVFAATSGTHGFWQRKDGAIAPTNITDDLLIGATATSSAKIRLARDNGNITASGDIAVNGGDITTGSSTFTIGDGSNALLTIIDNGATADAIIQGADFVQLNSYFADEFNRERADLTADTTLGWGDDTAWSLDVNTACTVSNVDDTINGITRLALSASNSCLLYTGSTTAADAHLLFDADNKPVMLIKVRPSAVSATEDLWVGIGDDTASSTSPPTNGIFFTNNGGTAWTGVTRSSSTSTAVSCSGQTISTSQFGLLKIEVRSTTNVRFFVDSDVSNGISFTECGSGSSTNIPTTTLAGMIKSNTISAAQNLDIDFFRVWQDDPSPPAGGSGQAPAIDNSGYNQQSGADIVENYLTFDGQDFEPATVVSIASNVAYSVEPSRIAYDRNLIGIISTNPRGDLILGEGGQGTVRVALLGRVPVKVSSENGPIEQGDYLTSASIPGVAMKATKPGPVVGKALEEFSCSSLDVSLLSNDQGPKPNSCLGKILVFVNLSWFDPGMLITPNGDLFVNETTYSGVLAHTDWEEKTQSPSRPDLRFGEPRGSEKAFWTGGLSERFRGLMNNVQAGLIETEGLIVKEVILAKEMVTNRLQATTIASPFAQFDIVQTNLISPLASDTVVIEGKLAVKEASISGTLVAGKIIAQEIEGLEAKLVQLTAQQWTDYGLESTANASLIARPSTADTVASDSSTLRLGTFFAESGSFFDGLISLGPAGFTDVSVTGLLTLGSTFIITDNAINVLDGDLKLQPLGLGGVSIADGKVYIDSKGNLSLEGIVTAGSISAEEATLGQLQTTMLSPIPDEDLIIRLGQKSPLARGLPYQELIVQGATGSAVLHITSQGDIIASGSANVNNLTTEKLKLPAFIEKVKANSVTETSNGSVGKGIIVGGSYEVTIETPFVTEDSLIYISPTADTKGLVPYIARQIPHESFTVAISDFLEEDVTFNWWIIN